MAKTVRAANAQAVYAGRKRLASKPAGPISRKG